MKRTSTVVAALVLVAACTGSSGPKTQLLRSDSGPPDALAWMVGSRSGRYVRVEGRQKGADRSDTWTWQRVIVETR